MRANRNQQPAARLPQLPKRNKNKAIRKGNRPAFSWITLSCLIALAFQGCQCDRDKAAAPSPIGMEFAVVAKSGADAPAIYARLVEMGWDYMAPESWYELSKALAAAPTGEPPACSSSPGETEVFWAIVFAKVRGGAWKTRLPDVCRASRQDAMAEIRYMHLTGVTGVFDSEDIWGVMRFLEGHPDLPEVWRGFVRLFQEENRKIRPKPDGPPVRQFRGKPVYDWSSWIPPDRAFLVERDVRDLVTRDQIALGEKWVLVSALHAARWLDVRAELRKWILIQTAAKVRPQLKKLADGQLSVEEFRAWFKKQDLAPETAVLAEFMSHGPNQELTHGVVQWLEGHRPYTRATPQTWEDEGRAEFQAALPQWLKAFPRIKHVKPLRRGRRRP